MRNKKRISIIATIILLAVGFAAVSTSLIINGTALFGTNIEDFDVYFSKAILDGNDVSGSVISTNGKTITYETNALAIEGDESILEYTVLNNSTQYDAKVEITCELEENAYVIMEHTLENEIIEAQSEETGTLTATLIKTAVDPKEFDIVCNITASAVEKEEVTNIPDDTTYSLYGTLVDEEGVALTNTTVVTYSDPVYAVTDEDGYFYIEGLERGSHSLYVMGNISIEDIKDLSESEIEAEAVTTLDFTTSTMNIVFENGYEMRDEVIEPTTKVSVTFDANGGSIENDTTTVSRGNYHGELPELTREHYEFLGWYTEASAGTKVESTSIVTEGQKLYAQWQGKPYTLNFDANGGSVSEASKIVNYGSELGTLPTPTRKGYAFTGWYTETSGGTKYEETTIVNFTTETTIYAGWVLRNYEVGEVITIGTETFNVTKDNGNTVTMLAQYNLGTNYRQSTTANYVTFANIEGWPYYPGPLEIDIQVWSTNPKTYVNQYVAYMQTAANDSTITGGLISMKELKDLGCTIQDDYSWQNAETCVGSSHFSWLVNGQHWWTRSASSIDESKPWRVMEDGLLDDSAYSRSYGVRPIITVPKLTLANI